MNKYCDLYDVLERFVGLVKPVEFGLQLGFKDHQIIGELRSVGLHLPRQSGKTTLLSKWCSKHPDEVFIVHGSSPWLEAFKRLSNLPELPPWVSISKIRDNQPLLTDPSTLKKIKYVIVYGSSVIFSYCGLKRKDFNQWVADTFGTEIVVIHLG